MGVVAQRYMNAQGESDTNSLSSNSNVTSTLVPPPSPSRVELSDHTVYQSAPLDSDFPNVAPPSRSSIDRRRRSSGSNRIGLLARIGGGGGGGSLEEHSLSRAHQPLLHGHDDRMHPLLSPFGSPIPADMNVILDMVAHLPPEERAQWIAARWSHAQPEDVFVHAFSFLTPGELANVSIVNRSWSHAAYEPSLWTHMDLSALYTRVDDAFLTHLLGSNRFVQLQTLILEGCSAITNKSIKSILYYCPNLREIRLTDCVHINNPWVFVELVKALPYLKKLELFGVTKEFGIVTTILNVRPKLDLGLFWLEYCAENGMKLDGNGLASCRYDEAAEDAVPIAAGRAGNQRGCWGRVQGRIVYGNDFYHRGGNYPREVLYSCENHREQDFTDEHFHRCHVCERLFNVDGDSMWTPLICKVCFDETNLHNKSSWIALDASSLRTFGMSDVVSKTIHVASRKNLPVSLRSFGTTPARLDYNIPDPEFQGDGGEDDEEERKQSAAIYRSRLDLSDIPMSTFVGVNGWRIDETVRTIRGHLIEAQRNLNTRALLVYDADENIEVLADKRVILDGKEGEEHMQLTVQAWHQALEILYPIVIVMILCLHFSVQFVKQTTSYYNGTTNYSAYITQTSELTMSTILVLLLALVGVIILVICIILVYRYREQCERCFKRFLVADILAIFMFGVATLLWLLVTQWDAYMDTLTFIGIIWNLSMIGLMSLYYSMPERVHHFFLILLNSIMAIMLIATLGQWLVLTFLLIFSLGDIISELRPNMRFLSPFIIPTGVELIYNTPKILYTVGGLRLRAADLMCYGMLMGLALATGNSAADYSSVLLGGSLVFICVMSSMSIMLFIAPFIGCRFRPLPLAVIAAFICTIIQDPVFMPFIKQQNNLTVQTVQFN